MIDANYSASEVITSTQLADLANDAIATRQPSIVKRFTSTFFPYAHEKANNLEVKKWSTFITTLDIRYNVVADWIKSHKQTIHPAGDDSEPFFAKYKTIYSARDQATESILGLGRLLKNEAISSSEKIKLIREATIQAENTISQSTLASAIIRLSNDQVILNDTQLRNVVASAIIYSATELRLYTSTNNPSYSTLDHNLKVADFITNKSRPNDSTAFETLLKIHASNVGNANELMRQRAEYLTLAGDATLEQAQLVGKQNLINESTQAVQDWSNYMQAAEKADVDRDYIIKYNKLLENIFKGDILVVAQTFLQLPNIL